MNRLLEKTLFPVSKRPAGINEKTGRREFHIVNDLTGQRISVVSEQYTLIPNQTLIQPFLDKFGEPDRVVAYSYMKSYIFEFWTKKEFDLGGGDTIREKLIVRNSYDKSTAFDFLYGVLRKVCTNGMYAIRGGITFHKIHVGDIPVRDITREVLAKTDTNNFEFWRKLKGVPLTQDREVELIEGWTPFEFKKENPDEFNTTEVSNKRIKRIARDLVCRTESLDNQRNAWGLFNQLNQAVRREYGTTAQTSRRILGDRRSEEYLAEALAV